MSYELCNRVSVNQKKNVIKLSTVSNNDYPKTFSTWEYGKDMSFEEKMYSLFVCMMEGNLHFSTINDSTIDFVYADKKAQKYMQGQGLSQFSLWDLQGQERENKYKEIFEVFMRAYNDKFSGEYGVRVNGMKVNKLGKYNSSIGCYSRVYHSYYDNDYLKMDYKKAYVIADGFENAEVVKLDWVSA